MQRTRYGLIAVLVWIGPAVRAAEPSKAALAFFEAKIRPVLVDQCYECHSADAKKLRGGLLLDSREGLLKGGDSGPALVPGKPDESILLSALRFEDFEMPPKGKLGDDVVRNFELWIREGAVDPRVGTVATPAKTIDLAEGKKFWSFQPVRATTPPKVNDARWAGCSIDRFVAAKREEAGLDAAPAADRTTLIRRATFDLWGLPPRPEDIAAFVNDPAPDQEAFAKVVDRLLASPHFGERWGRHWLDVARYADTTGGGRSMFFNAAWRYRDYVIDSFNNDKPFDRFAIEQVAGDLMPYDSYAQGQQQLTATAFLVLGPTNYEEQDKEQLRMDVIDEQIDTTGRAFLGMTIGCARCHDHKFDPVPTRDYYALAGIFRSTRTLIHDNVSTWVKRPVPLPPEQQAQVDAHAQQMAAVQKQVSLIDPELKKLRAQLPLLTIDDDAAVLEGSWTVGKGIKEYVGEGYRHAAGSETTTATYDFTGQVRNGAYEVRVSYCANPNRAEDATVEVIAGNETKRLQVNQQASPGSDGLYYSLGTFQFRRNKPAKVVVIATGAKKPVVADAVQLIPRDPILAKNAGLMHIVDDPMSLPGVVIDDSMAEVVGAWTSSVSVKSYVGGGYIHDDRAGKGEKKVIYRADLPKSGAYDVRLAYNAADSRTSKATVRVTHRDGEAVVTVNQQQQPDVDGLFHSLGQYQFTNDVAAVVTLSNEGADDGYVIADAVWLAPAEDAAVKAAAPVLATTNTGAADNLMETASRLIRLESEHQALQKSLDDMKKSAPEAPPQVLSIQNEDQMGDYCVCIRGNVHTLGDTVPRSFLQVAMTNEVKIPEGSSGRLELAQWIGAADNPLTARVYVNRVWQKLFDEGLVRSVDNFGVPGDRPTHPELLDSLAAEFMADGWSTKRLIRRIMLSETWRMSCERSSKAKAADPENKWLAGQNRKRLDAEAIRDALHLISGKLDLTMAGDTIRPGTKSEYTYEFDEGRRSIYLPILRNRLPDTFAVFDFPDPNLSTGKRSVSTLPTQALYLMNSDFIRQTSQATAELVAKMGATDDERLTALYLRSLGRSPSAEERYAAMAFLRDTRGEMNEARAWTNLVHAIFSCVDFRYVD